MPGIPLFRTKTAPAQATLLHAAPLPWGSYPPFPQTPATLQLPLVRWEVKRRGWTVTRAQAELGTLNLGTGGVYDSATAYALCPLSCFTLLRELE